MLAMLALAPEHRHARSFIQDKLWSRVAPEQGRASLRQSLSDIKRSLADHAELLHSSGGVVSMNTERMVVDMDPGAVPDAELLEGIDLAHEEEFEDWLRVRRAEFSARTQASAHVATIVPPTRSRLVFEPASETVQVSEATEDAGISVAAPFDLVLVDGTRADDAGVVWLANSLISMAAEGARELGLAQVFDHRGGGFGNGELARAAGMRAERRSAIMLRADTAVAGIHQLFRFELILLDTRELIWSSILELDASKPCNRHSPALLAATNQVISVLIARLAGGAGGPGRHSREPVTASSLCLSGIQRLFRLGASNFEEADRLFAKAYAHDPRGLFLAWRAYLRTFVLAERVYDCRDTVTEEALAFRRRALEAEPGNSFVLALSGHVETIVTRSYTVAVELADRSLATNAGNPIGWAVKGIARGHLGEVREGLNNTLIARQIAGSAPYRFQLDALACIAGSIAGDFATAQRCAEASHAASPLFAPPLRYLTGLYLKAGRQGDAEKMIGTLRETEPGFNLSWLGERDYPAAGLRRSGLLRGLSGI
ncbi:MAG: hypothetical protein AAGA95_09100 [Pseudomonadota bacterium]